MRRNLVNQVELLEFSNFQQRLDASGYNAATLQNTAFCEYLRDSYRPGDQRWTTVPTQKNS